MKAMDFDNSTAKLTFALIQIG